MYGAAGTLPAEWETYAQYWVDGAGKPSLHDVSLGVFLEDFLDFWGAVLAHDVKLTASLVVANEFLRVILCSADRSVGRLGVIFGDVDF